jgi:hypothetical protein
VGWPIGQGQTDITGELHARWAMVGRHVADACHGVFTATSRAKRRTDCGCSQSTQAPKGTFLAYEHHVTVKLPGKDIAARIGAIEAACFAQIFGDCAVLNVEQRGGDFPGGNVTMRIAPKGVEPMIQRGASGGDIERHAGADDDPALAHNARFRAGESCLIAYSARLAAARSG